MQAKPGVIDHLNAILMNELTAINQYFLQAKMCRNWGYARLGQKLQALSIEEMREADSVIDHLLYLEGVPNMQRLGRVQVGENVAEHFQLALQLEQNQVATLATAITHCAEVSDFTTRGMLEGMIRGEEADIDWLETQLETIRQVGLEQYLSQHIQEG